MGNSQITGKYRVATRQLQVPGNVWIETRCVTVPVTPTEEDGEPSLAPLCLPPKVDPLPSLLVDASSLLPVKAHVFSIFGPSPSPMTAHSIDILFSKNRPVVAT